MGNSGQAKVIRALKSGLGGTEEGEEEGDKLID